MSNKDFVMSVLEKMPEDSSIESIYEKLDFILSVREGIAQADRDEGISLEEWTQKIGTCSTKPN